MNLSSPDFSHGSAIPRRFAVEWDNVSPTLVFEGVPGGTVSLALLVEDPDVPKTLRPDGLWTHWIAWNLPKGLPGIPSGATPPGTVGQNGRGNRSYGGPNPPDGEHRYFFRLFALDAELDLPPDTDRYAFLEAVQGHVLEESVLLGTYVRSDFARS